MQLSGYRIAEKIGQGGMATVYKGEQLSLKRPVAIKVLLKNMIEHSEVAKRFERESLIIAKLSNAHIIHVIDRGISNTGMPYFVMEYVPGTELRQLIREGTLSVARKLKLCLQICKALAYAHKNGVIHRDIKPANILVDRDDNARVLDFGIAQFRQAGEQQTQIGQVMGTAAYMAPEQRQDSASISTLSDLYSLGVMMYELFTGQLPMGAVAKPSQLEQSLPKQLDEIIMHCMQLRPDSRPESADAVKTGLLKVLRGNHLNSAQHQRAASNLEKSADKFSLLDVIKEDEHGAVYLYEQHHDHQLMVIKKRQQKAGGFRETKLLRSLSHPNILEIKGTSGNNRVFIAVTEYVLGGNLHDRLVRPYSTRRFLLVAKEICCGLIFAHNNQICHGNLRPQNILFDANEEVKIADFGLQEHYSESDNKQNWYHSNKEPLSITADIFATGVIFYQMLCAELPRWRQQKLVRPKDFSDRPVELQNMVAMMLEKNPEQRMTNLSSALLSIDELIPEFLEQLTELEPLPEPELEDLLLTQSETKSTSKLLLMILVLSLAGGFYLADKYKPQYLQQAVVWLSNQLDNNKAVPAADDDGWQ